MTLVQFNHDVSPYCKGDVVRLEGDEQKRVDDEAKRRNVKDAYTALKAKTETKKTAAKK